MLTARFRLRAVSSVRLTEACPKSSTAAYMASLRSKLGSEAKPNEVLAASIDLFSEYFQNSKFDLII